MNELVCMSTEETIRLECLELAVKVYPMAPKDVILKAAFDFNVFVREGLVKDGN